MLPLTTLAGTVLLVTSPATAFQQSPPDSPNVVLIMTDDAGYADIGSYGATDIRTPNSVPWQTRTVCSSIATSRARLRL